MHIEASILILFQLSSVSAELYMLFHSQKAGNDLKNWTRFDYNSEVTFQWNLEIFGGYFGRLHKILWPTTKSLHEAERVFALAKEAVAAREEGAAAWLEAAKEEYDFAFVLSSSAMEYHLHVKKDE